eukprot:CAMPEP_0119035114 /NCGR_PEP_ID=MMETSP1177-20130426/2080_1 /TAXON_ID=2985 /ORGANISM="Ochromonas sp, Strain CCMP1899" /LENGTH=377 /DNA_ID=CAMNT_0006993035 /DNA_START=379 /DNA_END=1509 /DNA_ORIENTATION=+
MTIIGLIVTGVISSPTLQKGNPYRLLNAIDYQGRICGYDGNLTSTPFGYYLPDKTAVCVNACPTVANYKKFICDYNLQAEVDKDTTGSRGVFYLTQSSCMYEIKSKVVLNRCAPDMNLALAAAEYQESSNSSSSTQYDDASSDASWVGLFLADVLNLRVIIGTLGLGLATILSFLYLYFLRIPGLLFIIIWTIMLAIQALFIVGSILLYNLSIEWRADGKLDYEILTMEILSYIGFAASFLWFCLMFILRKRIQLAIGIIKEAAKSIAKMPILILLPILQVLAMVVFLIPWFIYVIYLASSGDTINVDATTSTGEAYTYRKFVYTENTKYAFIYMLFCWFWTSEFILAIGQLTVALAVVAFYFNRDKKKIGNLTVVW